MDITAAVVDEVGGPFHLRTVTLDAPDPDEVLLEIAGVGLCHTDLAAKDGHLPFPLPGVFGHEGSGTVLRVGSAVTKVAPGDNVVLSFHSCGQCTQCKTGAPAYCLQFMPLNFGGARPDGRATLHAGDTSLGSEFFGQSSFGTHALAHERNVVKVPDDAPLEILGPLGCGIQTGAGAVLNSLDCPPGSSILVLGGGSVGLSAVMAAAARGLSTILVLEPHEARRALALELGATHALDPADGPLPEQVRAILPEGVDHAIDTTGLVTVLEAAVQSLAQRGKVGIIGVPSDPTAALPVGLIQAQMIGLTVVGIVEGDSDPDVFIPELLELHRSGRFPIEKLITTAPFTEINEAVERQARGEAVKIVLTHR
ncbi:alcohol dehydrogenase catalytic domain-containing protein [Nakamurella sp. YIM 132087]|uniref:Alcohol dehydrogenase catalytic domain-containing protein n=1 Tax=Nakamurella alba TaxID=2665158 RepID=A0A7K1FEI2_9ACTN|nr:NAD(P)-dependent alcohol dehydrogenase [Nakamurella alba]MTD12517.1 alcohol dehydrogenase catalytic domain-containing protein [Nakamurella alba]